jgi:hypothetical protein
VVGGERAQVGRGFLVECAAARFSVSGCLQISVYDASGMNLLGSQSFNGDDATSSFLVEIVLTGGPDQICIGAASARDEHVIDLAPNSGCFPLALGPSGGGSGLN